MNNVYKLHAQLIKARQHENPLSLRNLLQRCVALAPEGMSYARALFATFSSPDTFAYNTIIRVHAQHSPIHAFSLFDQMRRAAVPPDNFTFPFVLKVCARFKTGQDLHSLIVKLGFDSDIHVQNALINVYGCCSFVEAAIKLFDEMHHKDLVSWSTMIACFANNGFACEALALFQQIQLEENAEPDGVIILSVISAISSLGALELGIWVHAFIVRRGLGLTVPLGTALIDMYSRCGSIDHSIEVFDEMPARNIVTWTTLINGLAVHGRCRESLKAFDDMRKSGLKPDYIIFTGTLVACSHGGLVEDGWRVFESMRNEYHIKPMLEHYGCMVDLLGRAGLLREAFKFVEEMPIKPNSVIWRTLLGACVNHNHLELAEKAKERINELDPHHDGDYVLLSNLYGGVGRWAEKAGVRNSMRENRIIKEPGHSLINIDQVVHEFVSGDNSHPQWEEIREFLVSVINSVKVGGYTPITSTVLHDIEEEEKEHSLGYHSEKLAVAYVLLNYRDRRTIRIIKNLRICYDCHNFIKHVSDIFDKNIIIRDRNRFHHFSKGSCSCRDYCAKRVFEFAVEYSRNLGHNFIAPEHITVALVKVDDGSATRVLNRLGANGSQLAAVAFSRLQGELAKDGREPNMVSKGVHDKSVSGKGTAGVSSTTTKETSALSQFCMDLTARAGEGLIDPIIGREVEVQRIIQILCRRTKSNPILLGESGVGKTAIAEGLAIHIARADVPVFLLTKRVMSLDVALLMAGAKERGELEERVTKLIKEIMKSGDVILFIDEVHTLIQSGTVGRGNKGGSLDIANLLKPSLGRGQFQCIASTTIDEYRMHFEKDKALARRFQPVWIDEPSEDDAVQILMGLQEKYEAYHKCRYTPEAIKAAVHLSARYIADRYLPDKAIDLIDEAGSRAHIEGFKRKREQQTCILSKCPSDYWKEIRTVHVMHEVAQESKLKYYGASSIDDTSELILDSYLPSTANDDESIVVGLDDIAAVASLWSGIPVQQLTADQRMLLVDLDRQLRKRVIGQDEAVSSLSRAVKRSRVGLKDPDRPIATMLFCGPTGVGKTELAKSLAACYFGSEAAMIRLDMSEYMERHTVSKLIGSPPGYVGYEEGGILTKAVRRKPFTLLLLDEIEKAHPDVFNILLQLTKDGHLTDSQGRRVSFKNALVVMTSNVGSSAIAKGRHNSIGFLIADDKSSSYSGLKSIVMEELRTYFRPELLNRIDEVVVFQPLEKAQLLEILELRLKELKDRVLSLGIGLEVSESIKNLVCQQGYNPIYGARHLRRAITSLIEDPLSEALLAGECKAGDTALVDLDADDNPFVTNQFNQVVNLTDTTHPSS